MILVVQNLYTFTKLLHKIYIFGQVFLKYHNTVVQATSFKYSLRKNGSNGVYSGVHIQQNTLSKDSADHINEHTRLP